MYITKTIYSLINLLLLVILWGCNNGNFQNSSDHNSLAIADSFRNPTTNSKNIPEIPLYDESGNDIILLNPIPNNVHGLDPVIVLKSFDSLTTVNNNDSLKSFWYCFQIDNFTENTTWILSINDSIINPHLFLQQKGNNNQIVEIKRSKDIEQKKRSKYPLFKLTLPSHDNRVIFINLGIVGLNYTSHVTFRPFQVTKNDQNIVFYAGIFFTLVLLVFFTSLYFLIYSRDVTYFIFIVYFLGFLFFSLLPYFKDSNFISAHIFFFKTLGFIGGIAWYSLLLKLATHPFKWSRYMIMLSIFGFIHTSQALWWDLINISAMNFSLIAYCSFAGLFLLHLFLQRKKQPFSKLLYPVLTLICLAPCLRLLHLQLHVINPSLFYTIQMIFVYATPILFLIAITLRFSAQRKQLKVLALARVLINQRELSQTIIKSLESERKRFAEDLHDELGSNLAALKIQVKYVSDNQAKLDSVMHLIDSTSESVRNISHNLMPPHFSETSLEIILAEYFNDLNSGGSIKFKFYYSGKNGIFSKEEELMFYRIIIELAHNCLKHSKANEAVVQLIYHDTYLEIFFEDNGIGFLEQTTETSLHTIRSRVLYLNGSINIDSNENGTTVIIQIPVKKTV